MRVVELNQLEQYRRRRQKRKSFKKLAVTVFTISFVVSLYTAFALSRPLPTVKASPVSIKPLPAAAVVLPWPKVGTAAVGAVGYGLLDSKEGGDKRLPSASVMKALTALVVLQKHPLKPGEQGPSIRITTVDTDSYHSFVGLGGSVFPVNIGQELTEYEALQALLLPSANNIADTLARWAYGSLEAYQQAANTYIKTLDMHKTHVADASGLSPQTVSTANDLVRLGIKVMEQPVIAGIVSQREALLPGGYLVRNVNTLLGQNNIVGIKTGTSDEAGGCFLFAANRIIEGKTITVVGAIMAEPDRHTALADSLPLSSATLNGFESVTAIKKGQVLNTYDVPWQGKISAVAKDDVRGIIWKSRPPTVEVDHPVLFETRPSVDIVPHASARFGDVGASTDMVMDKPAQQPTIGWKLLHPLR